jgi:phosphatidylserine/phosphatidylglycerophosphate/cardiolipin synthase-like enzyme
VLFGFLSLAIGVGAPAMPVAAVISDVTIGTCFAPEENCSVLVAHAVDSAEREILVHAYSLTIGSGVLEALIRAAKRGVNVRLIAGRTTPCERRSGISALARAGASIWIDRGVRIAHAKSMVIDEKVILVGSMNWSAGAERNSEDLNVISSAKVAEAYAAHWRQRLSASVPFTEQETCRRRSDEDGP